MTDTDRARAALEAAIDEIAIISWWKPEPTLAYQDVVNTRCKAAIKHARAALEAMAQKPDNLAERLKAAGYKEAPVGMRRDSPAPTPHQWDATDNGHSPDSRVGASDASPGEAPAPTPAPMAAGPIGQPVAWRYIDPTGDYLYSPYEPSAGTPGAEPLYRAPVLARAGGIPLDRAMIAAPQPEQQERTQDRIDAERYRWLRQNCQYGFEDHDGPQLIHRNGETGAHQNARWREDLDAAIDAARSAASHAGEGE